MLLNDGEQDQGVLGGGINHLANTLGVFGFSRHSPTHERGRLIYLVVILLKLTLEGAEQEQPW